MSTPPDKRWRARHDRGAVESETEAQIRRLRYEEWMATRDLVGTIIYGGVLSTDGWGHLRGYRVRGYTKAIDKAIELAMKDIGLGDRRNESFYADLTLQLWTPSGPKA